MKHLSRSTVLAAGLDDWRMLAQALHARYLIGDFSAGAAFVAAVAAAADEVDHHPDLTLRYGHVDVVLATHEEGRWVTQKDVDLARTITALAREHRLEPEPGVVAQVELGLDTARWPVIAPFWSALLTGGQDALLENNVLDPRGQTPNVWFQDSPEKETPRQRWHLDVWVAPETAQARIDAALAAGGVVVDDAESPAFVVLADQDGNKACICTTLDRG